MKNYDVRGNRKNGYYVDTILENCDRILGAQRFDTKSQAEIYIERQREQYERAMKDLAESK